MELKSLITFLLTMCISNGKKTTAFLLTNSQCVAPAPCHCDRDYEIRCGFKALTDIPQFSSANSNDYTTIVFVDLSGNQFTSIPANVFRNLSSINTPNIQFNFDSNKINNINVGAFVGVENKIWSLLLRNNKLTILPLALKTLNKLKDLYLIGNPMVSLDPSIILHLSHHLTTFSFEMATFHNWPIGLSKLHLQKLTIRKIPFSHLPLDAFVGSESGLTSLRLSISKLVRIPSAICHLLNLQSLYFTDNAKPDSNVTLFEPCSHNLNHLTTLEMFYANLYVFPDILHALPSLTSLLLSSNNIRFVHNNVIPDLNNLKVLNIEHNHLTRIPFALNKLRNLERLLLYNNRISTIEDQDLVNLSKLTELRLGSNPIVYVAPGAFKNNLNLSKLNLVNTMLHLIPEAVRYLPRLTTLLFANNNAECSCNMSYLKSWNVTVVSSIGGSCANLNMTIELFLSTELPFCP